MALIPRIQRFRSVGSTNSEAARLALEGADEGLCIVADEQTEGRGRLQRQWVSPLGAGLYFSILLRPTVRSDKWPLLTLMAAVAVHDALVETCNLDLDIKWPNDLLAGGRKICGILAETVESDRGRAVVLGIGINLTSHAFPPDLAVTANSVEEASGTPGNREAILQALIERLAGNYQLLDTEGGDMQVLDAWSKCSSYANGKLIRVSAGDETIEGLTRGIEADGALRVETSKGNIKVIRAGDVTAVRQRD
jgi:BirA family biotin operon repressor/biotin-[acetyl-CoA-carboxylase] ligase